MSDIETAKEMLARSAFTCVLCKGDVVYTSTKHGVAPLLEWIDSGKDLQGFSAADKVVGKAAALLFILTRVTEIYAPIMSETAIYEFSKLESSILAMPG